MLHTIKGYIGCKLKIHLDIKKIRGAHGEAVHILHRPLPLSI